MIVMVVVVVKRKENKEKNHKKLLSRMSTKTKMKRTSVTRAITICSTRSPTLRPIRNANRMQRTILRLKFGAWASVKN